MFDPRLKFILVLMVGSLAVILNSAAALGLLAVGCGLSLIASGIPARWKGRAVAIILAIVWSTVLSQSLFYGQQPRTALLEIGPLVFWREGLEHGLVQSIRFIGISLAGIALAISTPPDKLLSAMQKMGIPSGLCFLTVTALRFMPTVGNEILTVRAARRHRSGGRISRRPWVLIATEVSLLMPILARSLRRARSLAESMHIRGFDPRAHRSSRQAICWTLRDTWVLMSSASIFLSVASAKALYLLYTLELTYHPKLRSLYGWCRDWL